MPGPEVYAGCPFMGRLAGRGLDPSQTVKKLHSCLFACVGATIGRLPACRSNTFSGRASCTANGHGRAMLAPTSVFRQPGRGLDPSAAARGLAALRISRNRLRRGVSGTPPSTGCPKSICAKQKATTCFSDGRFYFACYRLSIIFATISVAVLTYSVMLNCLTTSTS